MGEEWQLRPGYTEEDIARGQILLEAAQIAIDDLVAEGFKPYEIKVFVRNILDGYK